MSILKPNKIKFGEIFTEIGDYLNTVYSQRGDIFSSSSPFGQILTVMQAFFQMIFLYLEDSLVEMNITTATKTKSIYGFARITGHNPTRSISAQGTIKLKWKPSVVDVNMSYATLLDKSKLICENNNLPYFVQLGSATGNIKINKSEYNFIPIKIIQGETESQTKIGTGKPLQSYNFQSNKPIDNDNVIVMVNGEPFEIVDSLYDMTKGDKLCMVKTGLAGGIDLYFGNEDFGYIPPSGSNITIEYVKTDGFAGNVFGKTSSINFKWVDSVYTNTGEEVDFNEYMNVSLDKPIILGADGEDPQLTKLIAPKMSRSFVLANPENYVSMLSRFNYSYVDAYTTYEDDYIDDDNVVYLFLIPDIARRLTSNTDYFTTNLENFYLDQNEKEGIYKYINQSGQQMISSELEIVDPVLTKYVMNIFLRIYDTANVTNLNNEILNKVTEYLLKVRRRDKVPKSDLIAMIEAVDGVDSVNVTFISEVNEKSIKNGYYIKRNTSFDAIRGLQTITETRVEVPSGTDPNLGLDDFGDVKIGLNELPVFRGGWYDRFDNYYEDGVSFTQYSSVNIVIKEVIKDTIAVQQMNQNKKLVK
jgi:hypothetical protein